MLRSVLSAVCAMCGVVASAEEPFQGKAYEGGDVFADTWVATDGAGRALPDVSKSGPPRPDKFVGMFYWTWHTPGRPGPFDNTKLLSAGREGKVDWGNGSEEGTPHHWGEPELGYYVSDDRFVIRRHASLLADAGVDVIFFDTTNPPHTFRHEYEKLCREYAAMRAEGARTPSIAFVAPFGDPRPVVDTLWRDLYEPGEWRDLWFMWEGKPLLLADPAYVRDAKQRAFFTFRRPMPDYWQGPSGPDQWSWLEVHPQHPFTNAKGEVEQVSVGVAQNALPNTPGPAPMSHKAGAMGRSWHGGRKDDTPGAVDRGPNFDEQWTRAVELDPKVVFVTGWNEWIAGRYTRWSKYTDADCLFPGGLFVDEYSQEYSRDIEPMRGGHGDNYYYQLAGWVRRFKGVRARPIATGTSKIVIDGKFDDWTMVLPEYRDTISDVARRDHAGYGGLVYRDNTGRNDIVIAKAGYDDDRVYFFVQTSAAITPPTDGNWMQLFIDADQDPTTGWAGFDFAINLDPPGETATTVRAWRDGAWRDAGTGAYRLNGNGMELAVPRASLGMAGRVPSFDFHWADGVERGERTFRFEDGGDSAPNRRCSYRFEVGK